MNTHPHGCPDTAILPDDRRMDPPRDAAPPDHWSEWVLRKRHGGDPSYEHSVQRTLDQICTRVLDGARLREADTLLDVGCGDGLIGLGALNRTESVRVVFLDISEALLSHCRQKANARAWGNRSAFVLGSAERLAGIADNSVDVVTARAVLAYVADKGSAVREIRRVLKPGGRVSIGEPIFRDQSLQISLRARMLQVRPPDEATAHTRLVARWKAAQFPSNSESIVRSPLTNFSEWDLVGLFQDCGFSQIHLELHIDVRRTPAMPWSTFIEISPHPLAPSLREILAADFTPEEAKRFEAVLRPSVESGGESERDAIAYLTAVSP